MGRGRDFWPLHAEAKFRSLTQHLSKDLYRNAYKLWLQNVLVLHNIYILYILHHQL